MKKIVYNICIEIEPFIFELNQKTNNEYSFMLKSATLDSAADFCVIEIYYHDGVKLDREKSQELKTLATSILPNAFRYEINFIKNYVSPERIESDFDEFVKKNFPSVFLKLEKLSFENMCFKFFVKIDELSFEYAKEKNFEFVLEKYFKNLYSDYSFSCEISKGTVYTENTEKVLKENYKEIEANMSEFRKIEISDITPLLGSEISVMPSYIKDKLSPCDEVTLCGKIKNIKEIIIKKKPKEDAENPPEAIEQVQSNLPESEDSKTQNDESVEAEKEQKKERKPAERKLFRWFLQDFTGSIPCVFFSNKENYPKLFSLENETSVVVTGKIEEDKFNGGVSFIVRDLSFCKLPEKFEEYIIYHEEKPFYEFVNPEKIITYKQNNLMNFAEQEKTAEYLKNKTFVCYDLETTGLHYEAGDRMIEIGAVKIEDGKITEKFMTYVDPEKHIPEEASKINKIFDADVAGAPKDFEALQDFFKFTRGAIIIGYNILDFDNVFLIEQGKNSRWDFSKNEFEDVYKMAQKLVHGVKNYKLKTIAEKLGVVLDNAHRAVFDAMATAEVFVKLADFLNNNQV